uniref:Calcium-transporting ATPase 12 plasma membrane-type-like n=1 Tax=Rhizophora mucronata TaxID=61149 RepID=A0A2P2JA22_RHIMU
MHMEETRHNCRITQVESFNSEKKRSGVMIRRGNKKVMNVHWKGAAEMIVAMCSNKYNRNGELQAMSHEDTTQFGAIIENMAAKSLRCIAFAHRKIEEHNAQISEKLEETGLTLLGLIGLKDPCQPGVGTAVETCEKAGVNVKMITGNNIHIARAIAIECGILDCEDDTITKLSY